MLHAFLKNCFNAFGDGHRLGGVCFFLQESSGLLSGSRGYRFFFCVCVLLFFTSAMTCSVPIISVHMSLYDMLQSSDPCLCDSFCQWPCIE